MPPWTIHLTQTAHVDASTEDAAKEAGRRIVEQLLAQLNLPVTMGAESLLAIEGVDWTESTRARAWWDGYLLGWRHALDGDTLPPTDNQRPQETKELQRLVADRDTPTPVPVRPTVHSDAGRAGLPTGTVVRSREGSIACRFSQDLGVVFGDERPFPWSALKLPLTILYSPADTPWLPPAASTDPHSALEGER